MNYTNKDPIKVSVVCAWYNRAAFIGDTIDSLLDQSIDSYEIILINDGSTDPKVKNILDSYKDDKLKIIHQENQGFVKTISRAISLSRGKYIAIQGAGDVSLRDRLKVQYEYMESRPNLSACAVGRFHSNPDSNWKKYISPVKNVNKDTLLKQVPSGHACMMYSKEKYLLTGGYDLRFRYCSDWDLYFRLLDVGEIETIDEGLVESRIFDDGFSASPEHKVKQSIFRIGALDRSENRDAYIDKMALLADNIKNTDYYSLKMSARFFLNYLKTGNIRMAKKWLSYFCTSLYQRFFSKPH